MTNINITQNKNTVTVNGETRVVTVKVAGPQGPKLFIMTKVLLSLKQIAQPQNSHLLMEVIFRSCQIL